WLQDAVPFEGPDSQSRPVRCLRYTPRNISTPFDEECSSDMFDRNNNVRCQEWVYNGEETTIVNEWNITCEENEWKLTLVGTVNNVGQFIGFPLAGFFSDRVGRRTTLVTATVGAGVMGLVRSMAWSYEAFVVIEFLDPVFASGIYTTGFVLGMELVGSRARVLGGTLISVFYALGEAILGGIALWLQNWRNLLRVFYAPALLCVTYHWLLPESVRWLLAMGKIKEARNVIMKAAKRNGVVLSSGALNKFEMTSLSEGKSESPEAEIKSAKEVLKQVLHSKILLLRVVNCSFCWVAITFVFFGLSLTSVSVGGNKFTNFILVAIIELPAYIVFYFTMDRFGRKSTMSVSLILSGISCITFAFVPTDLEWVRMLLFLMGKFSITISFTVVYVYTTEMFPTELRNSLLGVCAMVGRIGSMIAPQTPLLERYLQSLPLLLFGGMSILSGLFSLSFPETLNSKLPDTVKDAENIGNKARRTR
ncbi:Solute carrier family 22 member 21, partial [Zootermopsis nevadensis]